MDPEFWQRVITVREAAGKQLEKLRVEGAIGSSLDAEVDLYADEETAALLAQLEDELRFVLITSCARVHPSQQRPDDAVDAGVTGMDLWVHVTPSAHAKCIRCWHHREDVGSHPEHPQICGRCVENVAGDGETRRYA
jgi:isoleucyl-tRNA synthetase